jgi:hypothetical protein
LPRAKGVARTRDGDAADQGRIAEPADDGRVHEADQRRREVGKRHRQGNGEHAAVGHLERLDSSDAGARGYFQVKILTRLTQTLNRFSRNGFIFTLWEPSGL